MDIIKEYGIYERYGSGKPFIIHIYNNFFSIEQKLFEIINSDECGGRAYYVDNDFYNNKYFNVNNLHYLKIIVRDVSDWQDYSEKELKKENDNKILFMENFKKVLTK